MCRLLCRFARRVSAWPVSGAGSNSSLKRTRLRRAAYLGR
ncbi:DUF1010 domain-containing protein [Lampropedia puyangensis]